MANQLKKKFIGNDQVDGDKLKLLVGQTLRKDDGAGGSIDVLAAIDASIAVVQGDLANEIDARMLADADFESRITDSESNIVTQFASISTLQFDLDAAELAIANEVMRATGVEGGIDSRLVTAEGEINVLQFDLDANELALANEIMRATGIEGGIDSRLVTAEGEINVLQFDLDANELALANEIMRATGIEGGIDSRLVTAEGEINVLQFDLDAAELAISNEVMRATGVEGSLQSQITAISGGGSGSLSALQSEVDATQIGVGLDASGGYVVPVLANYINSTVSIYSAVTTLDAEIKTVSDGLATEVLDRTSAVSGLQAQINNVLSNVDAGALDSLTEIVSAFQAADSTLNGAITSLSTGLSADIDAEESARIAADAALDVRLDVLESVIWFKEKFSISNGQTSVTFSHVPESKSVTAFVDRLGIHEGASEDFTISGSTMTFLNDLVSPGQSQIGAGDSVYVKYQYKV